MARFQGYKFIIKHFMEDQKTNIRGQILPLNAHNIVCNITRNSNERHLKDDNTNNFT